MASYWWREPEAAPPPPSQAVDSDPSQTNGFPFPMSTQHAQPHDRYALVGVVLDGRLRFDTLVEDGPTWAIYQATVAPSTPALVFVRHLPPYLSPTARHGLLARMHLFDAAQAQLVQAGLSPRILGRGQLDASRGEALYVAVEPAGGTLLSAHIRQRVAQQLPPSSPDGARRMLLKVVQALALLHDAGMAHEGLSPESVLLVPEEHGPVGLLLHVGLASAVREAAQLGPIDRALPPLASPYAAIEQLDPSVGPVSPSRSDLQSLTHVFLELCTGTRPLAGADAAEWRESAQRLVPSTRGLHLPAALDHALAGMLSPSPVRLPATARELLPLWDDQARPAATAPIDQASAATAVVARPAGSSPHVTVVGGPLFEASAVQLGKPGPGANATALAPLGQDLLGPPPLGPDQAEEYRVVVHSPAAAPTAFGPAANGPAAFGPTALGPAAHTPGGPPPTQYGPTAFPPESAYPGTNPALPSTGPSIPPPPGRASGAAPKGRPGGGLGAPIAAGVLLTTVLAGGGSYWVWRNKKPKPPKERPEALVDGVRYYASFNELALEKGGELELTEATAKGRAHAEATFDKGRLVAMRELARSGVVRMSYTLTKRDDGATLIERRNGYGVVVRNDVVAPGGVVTAKARDGDPTLNGCASWKLEFDPNGRVAKRSCLGPQGQLTVAEEGCAVVAYERAPSGKVTSEACFDTEQAPTSFPGGGHRTVLERDANGFIVGVRRLSATGAPEEDTNGCTTVKRRVDATGEDVEAVCLDANGAPRPEVDGSPPITRYERDANGCVVSWKVFDAAGVPAAAPSQLHHVVYRHDAQCSELSRELKTLTGARVPTEGFVSFIQYTRDAEGKVTEQRCEGAAGPVDCTFAKPGVTGALVRKTYDPQGRLVSEKGFTPAGEPSRRSESYPHELRRQFLPDGHVTSEQHFSEAGAPAQALGTIHRAVYAYDRFGNLTSRTFFGVAQEPVRSSIGCHELARVYDERLRLRAIECRDIDGQPRAASVILDGVRWPANAARVEVERTGGKLANAFYNTLNQVITRRDCKKDRCHQ
jgi:hypothetical protein